MRETHTRERLSALLTKLADRKAKKAEAAEDKEKKSVLHNVYRVLRRKVLKVLALCERIRVRAERHPVSPLLYVVILALVALGLLGFILWRHMQGPLPEQPSTGTEPPETTLQTQPPTETTTVRIFTVISAMAWS